MQRPTQLIYPSRYGAAVTMNSTYDYDPASRKDEFVGYAAGMLEIVLHILRPDRGALVGAFPWCEWTFTSCLITR